jgi:hypothetical protein
MINTRILYFVFYLLLFLDRKSLLVYQCLSPHKHLNEACMNFELFKFPSLNNANMIALRTYEVEVTSNVQPESVT